MTVHEDLSYELGGYKSPATVLRKGIFFRFFLEKVLRESKRKNFFEVCSLGTEVRKKKKSFSEILGVLNRGRFKRLRVVIDLNYLL